MQFAEKLICIKNITFKVKTIGERAFKNCSQIVDITLPRSVKTIRDCAFEGCTALRNVVIPSSVTKIGEVIFNGCETTELVVFVEADSKAEAYCDDNVYEYSYWDGSRPDEKEDGQDEEEDLFGS